MKMSAMFSIFSSRKFILSIILTQYKDALYVP